MKKLALALLALLLVFGVGGYILFSNLDHIVKSAIEKYASAATQTRVTLDSVKLELTTGTGLLSGLTVNNPSGFSSAKAFYLGSINVKLDTGTVRGTGPIVINDVMIDQPQVTFELLNNGSNNLQTIQNNTQVYAHSLQGTTPKTAAPASSSDRPAQPSRKIIISNLVIKNGQVSVNQELLKGNALNVPLPEIHLTNIGKASGGATAAQVAEQVFSAITAAATQASVTQLAKEKINGLIKDVPASAIGKAGVDAVGSQLKGVFVQ